jgi:hypothetical protein
MVTAGKHVNNSRDIARQLLGKRVPAETDTHVTVEVFLDYKSGNGVPEWIVRSCQILVEETDKSSVRATVTRRPESEKLKNLHC